ncbi:MAG: glutathione transferase GstA [Legionella sp.]|nr:glutathione transferase GstA [Legionella sp.]
MKLFYAKGACSLVVRIVINEIGLTSDFEAVNLKTKKTESGGDFLAVNSKGSVPVLKLDNGKILTENAIILQYLADTSHADNLLPNIGNFKRYQVLEWVNYCTTEMHKSFSSLFNPTIPQEIKDSVFIPLIKSKLNYINNHLEHNKYLLGESFTLPDAYMFVMLMWASNFNLNLKDWEHVARYFADLKKRKSIEKSLKDEGL